MNQSEPSSPLPSFIINSQTFSAVLIDVEGNFIFANEVFKKRFAFIFTDFIGKPALLTIYPNDHEKCIQATKWCFANPDKSIRIQLRKPAPDGDFLWTDWEFSGFRDEKGALLGILCIGYDTTELRRLHETQERLIISEQRLQAILDSTKEYHIFVNTDYKVLSFNKKVQKVWQQKVGLEMKIGEDIRDLIPHDYREKFYINTEKAIKGSPVKVEEKIYNTWLSITYVPVQDSQKNMIGIAINITNIDSKKRAELKLVDNERKLSILANNFPDGSITLSDKNLYILYTGGSNYAKHGINPKMLEGRHLSEVLHADTFESISSALPSLMEGNSHSFEVNFEGFTYLQNIKPIFDEYNPKEVVGFEIVALDITEKKQKELKIIAQNESFKSIAWQQSHVVRRPLANILGLIELMKLECEKENTELYISYIAKAAQEIDAVIHQIVDEANKASLFDS